MQRYRLGLAITWLAGGGLIILTMILEATMGRFVEQTAPGQTLDRTRDAWEWLAPNIMPTLTLVLGVTALTRAGEAPADGNTRMLFVLALGLSIFYLLALALPLLVNPFTAQAPIDTLQNSNIFLAPIQGLVSSLLGVFFTREVPKDAAG